MHELSTLAKCATQSSKSEENSARRFLPTDTSWWEVSEWTRVFESLAITIAEGTLRSGDRLIAVNGTSLNEATLAEAQELLNNSECATTTMTVEYDVNLLECVRSATGPLLVEIERPCGKDLGVTLAATSTGRIIIEGVIAASIAERCGALHVGDQILAVDETRVEGSGLAICEVMELLQSSTVVTLEILPLSQAYYGRRRTNSNARYHGMLGPPSPSPSGYCSLSSQHLNRHNTCLHSGTLPEIQEDTISAPAATVQTVAPDSPDLLELFTEDGIFFAEIGCSTDYWDEGDVAPPSEAKGSSDNVRAQPLEIDDSLGSRATVMSIGADGVQAPLGSQAVVPSIISQSEKGYNDVSAELELLDHLIFEMDGENGGKLIPMDAASPPSQGDGVRAPRKTGILPHTHGWPIFGTKLVTVYLGAPASDRDALSWLEEQITVLPNQLQDHGVSADDRVCLLLNSTDSTLNPPHLSVGTFAVSAVCRSVIRTSTNANPCEKSATLKLFVVEADLRPVKTAGDGSQTSCVLITINVLVFAEVTCRSVMSKRFASAQTNSCTSMYNGSAGRPINAVSLSFMQIPPPSFSSGDVIGTGALSANLTGPTLIKNSRYETMETRYETTVVCLEKFKNAGYRVVEMWESLFITISSKVLRKTPLFRAMHRMNSQQRVALLKTADKKQIHAVCECIAQAGQTRRKLEEEKTNTRSERRSVPTVTFSPINQLCPRFFIQQVENGTHEKDDIGVPGNITPLQATSGIGHKSSGLRAGQGNRKKSSLPNWTTSLNGLYTNKFYSTICTLVNTLHHNLKIPQRQPLKCLYFPSQLNGGFQTLSWYHPYIYMLGGSQRLSSWFATTESGSSQCEDRRVKCVSQSDQRAGRRVCGWVTCDPRYNTVPVQARKKAQPLLAHISSRGGISWDENGDVSIHDTPLRGHNIVDLVNDLVRARRHNEPSGWREFLTAL
uniref:PDZ domain-containing protein n=1 Tax=Timema douglasi TaxID=61478 RepID=A0A7R8VJ26_TIMDO|nr:unnamed protein product [Timema douglasi]